MWASNCLIFDHLICIRERYLNTIITYYFTLHTLHHQLSSKLNKFLFYFDQTCHTMSRLNFMHNLTYQWTIFCFQNLILHFFISYSPQVNYNIKQYTWTWKTRYMRTLRPKIHIYYVFDTTEDYVLVYIR